MNKPMIGVVPLYDPKQHTYYMHPAYMQAIEKAGGIPVILPLTDDISVIKDLAQRLDGFLFTGGQDICPSLYDELERDICGDTCAIRDVLESSLFKIVLHLNKPILGIGRGLHLFNVLLGGTLYQDLENVVPTPAAHTNNHTIFISEGSPLYNIVKTDTLYVNSRHHQAIHNCADKLIPCALSEDHLIEAVSVKEHPFALAVQWHPEMLSDPQNARIFHEFIKRCTPLSPAFPLFAE